MQCMMHDVCLNLGFQTLFVFTGESFAAASFIVAFGRLDQCLKRNATTPHNKAPLPKIIDNFDKNSDPKLPSVAICFFLVSKRLRI